jgi:NitT/TauT family transport system permease protein
MPSAEHKKYLKNIKKFNFFVLLMQFLIISSFLLIWQYLADKKLINTFISSSPKMIMETIINLFKAGNLFNHIWVTVYETIISFMLATIIGLLIATLMWRIKFISKVIDPYLTILNSLPKIALGPIIIIWFGAKMNSIIIMALLISSFVSIINIYEGFKSVDNNKIKLMKSFKATKWQIYKLLILPSSTYTIISTLKINISMSLIGVIMGEFLVSKEGLGYLIMYGSQVFNLNLVVSGIFILCFIACLMYYLVTLLEKKYQKKQGY